METISIDDLARIRQSRYRQTAETCCLTERDALDFINDLGFLWFIDSCEADLPSLHTASPKPFSVDDHEFYASSWWDLKHTLTSRKDCYYAKVLRGRGTFISWECFPFFYAAYASADDYHDDYRKGILSREEKRILDLIGQYPGISSRDLRKKFGPVGKDVTRAMDRALQNLQETFRITVAGGSLEGWSLHYWALVEDWVSPAYLSKRSDLPAARKDLVLRYVCMAIAASVGDIAWVFRWKRKEVAGIVDNLIEEGLVREIEIIGLPGEMYTRNG
jgi:hypothetical protein